MGLADQQQDEAEQASAFAAAFSAASGNQPSAPDLGPAEQEPQEQATEEVADEQPADDLPPMVRAALARLDKLEQLAATIPDLTHKLRSAEGRVAAMQKAMPASQPPASKRLEKVERIRNELPEVVEAMEELFGSRQQPMPQESEPEVIGEQEPVKSALLDQADPEWRTTAASPEFDAWLKSKGPQYEQDVKTTNNELVFFKALTEFAQRPSPARSVQDTRAARAAAAATPNSAVRQPKPQATAQSAFADAFRRTAGVR